MKRACVLLFLIFFAVLVYFNSLGNGFHFDDYHHIVDNPHIKDIRNIPAFFTDITQFSEDVGPMHYRPLLLVTHSLNYYYGRLRPAGYQFVNLAFHVGSAFLLYLIMRAMLGSSEKGSSLPDAFVIALAAALIFTIHPFNSEVVNYIAARSSVMSGFFYLLAFYFWVKFRSQNRYCFYLASLLAFLFGMLTKEILITLPIVLGLYDLYFVPIYTNNKKKTAFPGHIRRLTLYIPFLAFVAIPYLLLRSYLIKGITAEGGPPRSYYINLITETKVLTSYMQMLFLPVNLSVEHVVKNASSFWEWEVIAATSFLTGILILSLYLCRHRVIQWRVVSFFIVWFFVTLLPTTIIPLEAMLQENRAYLAGISFAAIGGIFISKVNGCHRDRPEGLSSEEVADRITGRHARRIICVILTGMLIAIYSIMTIQRNRVWKDELTLWTDAVGKYPSSARGHFALANFHKKIGDRDKAIELYKKVLDLDPDYYEAYTNLAVIYYKEGMLDLAIKEFKKALRINPAHVNARMGIGKAYIKRGEIEMAEKEFKIALSVAQIIRQDRTVEDAMSYLKWIREKNLREVRE